MQKPPLPGWATRVFAAMRSVLMVVGQAFRYIQSNANQASVNFLLFDFHHYTTGITGG
jgi:hypothetical protein